MNSDIHKGAKCYGLYDNKTIIGFCGVIHQPHGKNFKLKRVTRLVILPDYQGIGLGTKFLEEIAKLYANYDFTIVTSAKNMIYALNKSEKWICIRLSVNKCSSNKNAIDWLRKSMRSKCKTASFMFRGENGR